MAKTTSQNNRLNIAVAGLGRMGKRHVRTLVNRVARANVVAVCSSDEGELSWARDEYKGSGINVYPSYEEMIQQPGLQAVWVSTSTDVHASQTLKGIEKGLHVLCEKPLSTDMEEVRTKGKLFHIYGGFQMRSSLFSTSSHTLSVASPTGRPRCPNRQGSSFAEGHGRLFSTI